MEFIETSRFADIREDYLDDREFHLLQLYLMDYPEAGERIKGSGGIRKLRWGLKGQGKRGGLRIIYYWITKNDGILFLTVYRKSQATDLSPTAIKEMKKIVKSFP